MRWVTTFPLLIAAACTPSREGAVRGATETYCHRALECDWYDESDAEDCYDDMEDVFDDLWPEEECEGDIVGEQYDECLDSIQEIDCGSWMDWLDALEECSSSQVCE